ncbi:hypothetical protein [Sulfuricurvum sp.]|uniref:hypothetical protein n=1 Tax=Sulfuricurvum sp. TaxID=2025608 RepID=UPI002E2EB6E7|nr:hypothetical protein [Sulfuricurvum sp.]HEX5329733.1 hypothetical protein [Sulfuricurvum sp.]
MSDIRLVTATIDLEYEEVSENAERFEREFNAINESEENSITQGIKHAKNRGELDESSTLILNVLVELYRKMDKMEYMLTHGSSKRLPLSSNALIESIGLEHFKITSQLLEVGKHYYARIEMATFPRREVAFYFEAIEPTLAKIEKMHVRDQEAWGHYMTACERIMIRQMKGLE